MKKTNAFIAADLAASMFTSCGGTDTAEMTSAESTVSETTAATVSETTLSAESIAETTAENTVTDDVSVDDTVTTIAQEQVIVPAPDAEFLLKLCNKWLSEDTLENGKSFMLEGSPTGTVTALYTDIDCDSTAEFCFIVDTYGSSALYVCDYINEAWEVVDILTIAKQYTYLQETGDGAASLFAVVGVRSAEGLHSYVYNNGVEEAFEMFDYTAFYDNELTAAENDEVREDIYYKAIEDALTKYDNLTYLYDLPCVTANLVNDVRFLGSNFAPDDFDSDAVQAKLDTFTAEVAALFQ